LQVPSELGVYKDERQSSEMKEELGDHFEKRKENETENEDNLSLGFNLV